VHRHERRAFEQGGELGRMLARVALRARAGLLSSEAAEGLRAVLDQAFPRPIPLGPSPARPPAPKREEPPPKSRTATLRWPRLAEDKQTPLGVDLEARFIEVKKLVIAGGYRVPGFGPDDFLGEVCGVILRRNKMPSAFDPRKSSFGHYVNMIARNLAANLAASPSRGREVLGESDEQDEATGAVDAAVEHFERFDELEVEVAAPRAVLWRQALAGRGSLRACGEACCGGAR
jgi:hypothetical protein